MADLQRPVKRRAIESTNPPLLTPCPALPLEIWRIIARHVLYRSPKERFIQDYGDNNIDSHYEGQRTLSRLASTCRALLVHLTPLLYRNPIFHENYSSKSSHANTKRCTELFLRSINDQDAGKMRYHPIYLPLLFIILFILM